jgi:hypothetical protein
MWEDPIVSEVRRAGDRLAAEVGGDLHRFFELLREAGRRHAAPPPGVADPAPLRPASPSGVRR